MYQSLSWQLNWDEEIIYLYSFAKLCINKGKSVKIIIFVFFIKDKYVRNYIYIIEIVIVAKQNYEGDF